MKALANGNSQAVIVGVADGTPSRERAPLLLHESCRKSSVQERDVDFCLRIRPVIPTKEGERISRCPRLHAVEHLRRRPSGREASLDEGVVIKEVDQVGRKEVVEIRNRSNLVGRNALLSL